MERKIAAIHRKTPTPVRQLPITGCAHKAGIVGDQRKAAHRVLAARDVPAERRRAAALDRTHHLQLIEARMVAVGLAPSGTMVAEDVRDLQSGSNHERRRYCAVGRFRCGGLRRASGLSILAIIPVATRV